jgi:CRP-like cAMP-binding protein
VNFAPTIARRLPPFLLLTNDEIEALALLPRTSRVFKAGIQLIREAEDQQCFLLLRGWAACYKLLENGGRQIINFPLPGDLVGLRSFLFQVPDYSVDTLTEVELAEFSTTSLLRLLDRHPRLAAALLWMISRDEAIVCEHLVNVGRRDATQRVAHLLLELAQRIGDREEGTLVTAYDCPLTQPDLADALGLTAIHVNRVLRTLRERQLVTMSRHRVTIHDPEALSRIAEFNPRYLKKSDAVSG